jgi:hypothetical protein
VIQRYSVEKTANTITLALDLGVKNLGKTKEDIFPMGEIQLPDRKSSPAWELQGKTLFKKIETAIRYADTLSPKEIKILLCED